MKNSRPRIKYSQTPHSVSRRIETITNKTAAALLSLINRKTVGFGQGFVDLPYSAITRELDVTDRTITRAAKMLEQWGDIVRERVAHRIYRWKIVLHQDEIIEDPRGTFLIKEADPTEQVLTDRSGPSGSIDQDHADRSIRIKTAPTEHVEPGFIREEAVKCEQKVEPLKKSLKETHVKKQHQGSEQALKIAAPRADDEPLYKFCLRSLLKYGVSQRVARKLCRENEHALIKGILDTVPQLEGVENVAGYLVTAIRDGGYSSRQAGPRCGERVRSTAKNESLPPAGQKNGHQLPGGRSNYAHLTDHNVKSGRHKSVKEPGDAPIGYRTVEETRAEAQRLEAERLDRESKYSDEKRSLAHQFRRLSEDVKASLKQLSRQYLEQLVPSTGRREEMLQDVTFQKIANRTVLEKFFDWIEQGLSENQALSRLSLQGS